MGTVATSPQIDPDALQVLLHSIPDSYRHTDTIHLPCASADGSFGRARQGRDRWGRPAHALFGNSLGNRLRPGSGLNRRSSAMSSRSPMSANRSSTMCLNRSSGHPSTDADLSHRADLRLRHLGEQKINRARGFQDDSPGSPDRRRKPQNWLNSASAPTH